MLREGVSYDDILVLSFTSEAAKQLRDRLEKKVTVPPTKRLAGMLTFHSWALNFCAEEHGNFAFPLLSNPLATEGQCAKKGYELASKYNVNYRVLRSWISLQKRSRVDPVEALKRAEKLNENQSLALAYKKYDAWLYETGCLDFDSLILEAVKLLETRPDIRAKYQYRFLMSDEFQDSTILEYSLLKLLSEKYKNLLVVGDQNQCQPAGTKVTLALDKSFTKIKTAPPAILKNIEDIVVGDKVQSWIRKRGYVVRDGREVTAISNRFFEGNLIVIYQGEYKTKVTPNHWMWATLVPDSPYQHLVYLMWREDYGFRVGTCRTAVYKNNRRGLGGLAGRCYEENADRAWILGVYETKEEARENEQIKAAKYGLPTCVFEPQLHHVMQSSNLKKIFSQIPFHRGVLCLIDHKKEFDCPLYEIGRPNTRYFKIHACNLIAGMMEAPSQKKHSSCLIDKIEYEPFSGLVYSLNVEEGQTYIADQIVVGNSIYSWRGADATIFNRIAEDYPETQTIYLGRNYRSTKKIVDYVKSIAPESDLIEHFTTDNEEGSDPEIHMYSTPQREAEEVVEKVRLFPDKSAILCRTNQGLRPAEDALINAGVKYHYLGDSGFYNRSEVKNALAYIQCASAVTDNALAAAIRSPFFPSKYIKKKLTLDAIKNSNESAWTVLTNDSTYAIQEFVKFIRSITRYRYLPAKDAVAYVLRDLKALEYYNEEEAVDSDNNPVENLKELQRVAAKYSDLREFLNFIRKIQAASKSRKGCVLSTIHGFKGRQAMAVYLVQCSEGMLPHKRSVNIDEESNAFYVAVSRPEKFLHISYTGVPSRFLKLGEENELVL